MKKSGLLLVICLLQSILVQAQCTIDSSNTSPGIYPDSLPAATTGQPYSQDVTFVIPTDTFGLNITNFQIVSISGLPVGLTWTCNNAANNCNYDPSVSVFGCINFSGTPLVPGTFSFNVSVDVTVQIVGTQSSSFTQQLVVLPASSSNNGFTIQNASGCAPLTVQITNNLPGQAAYSWDFGNGVQSTLEQPQAQTYTAPGVYIIRQDVTPAVTPSYFLTDIQVAGIPNNYGGFADDPDMYFLLYDPNGQQVYDSRPSIGNTFPPVNWGVPNIQLNPGNYSVHVWDEDGGLFGGDDDLGIASFNGNGPSGSATGTVGGASGQLVVNYTIFQPPVNIQTTYDTIYVYPTPSAPQVSSSITPPAVCEGTLITLQSNDTVNALQWFDGGSPLAGVNTPSFTPTVSGNYAVVATNSSGCSALSAPVQLSYFPIPPKPNFLINGNVFSSFLTGYTFQWYLNGQAISGANNSTYTAQQSGVYRLCITDSNGCENCSDTLAYAVAGLSSVQNNPTIILAPNPNQGTFYLQCADGGEKSLEIYNQLGQVVYYRQLGKGISHEISTSLSAGTYILELHSTTGTSRKRLVIE